LCLGQDQPAMQGSHIVIDVTSERGRRFLRASCFFQFKISAEHLAKSADYGLLAISHTLYIS
jgi:hypothetical protein